VPGEPAGVRFASPAEAENLNVLKMSFFDFVSLGLASLIVALTMFREVRDMNIGQMMTLQAVRRDHKRRAEGLGPEEMELCPDNWIWRYAIGVPTFLRRYVILPDVAATVVMMVARFGGDTVTIMLNTLAALFMLELDNLAFDYGLSEGLRASCEEHFKVSLGARQIGLLKWSRRWHVVSLTLYFLIIVNATATYTALWDRQRLCAVVLVAIIATGESIELIIRWRLRTAKANTERLCAFLMKVTIALVYKWYVFELQWGIALAQFVF
jgi:hypothetical protein